MAIGTNYTINTRDGLKAYIRRNLGFPVVNVEIDDSQLEDAINEAISEFIPVSMDGVNKRFRVIELECGKQEYTLDYDIYSVIGLYSSGFLNSFSDVNGVFDANYHIAQALMGGNFGNIDLLTLTLTYQQINTLDLLVGEKILFDYNMINSKLYLFSDPSVLTSPATVDGKKYVFMEFFQTIKYDTDPNVPNNLYDVRWVQQYSTALARRQWGFNMIKYEGTVLPGGMTINAQAMIDQGNNDADALMTRLRDEESAPVDFFIG